MASNSISRRDILKSFSLGILAGSVLRAIPLEAAELAHRMVAEEKAAGGYGPKFFPAHQYQTLRALCDAIIPADADSGGAVEAGAPEFIDLLTSENPDYQLKLGGGLMWLDAACDDRYRKTYLDSSPSQQKEILDLISYRANGETDSGVQPGIDFFAFLRVLTADGFFTSAIGIKYLGYIGNAHLREFPGCPPVPEA